MKKPIMAGIAIGSLFVFLTLITGIGTIALPVVPQALGAVGTGIVVIVLAPIVEELFFRWFLVKQRHINFLLSAALFTAFHYFAYSLIGGIGAFISSFIFAIAMYFMMQRFGLLANITAHATVNAWLLYGSKLLIG